MLLHKVLTRITRSPPIVFTADDLFRVCALMKGTQDVLGLRQHPTLRAALAAHYRQLPSSSVSPFQKGLLDDVLGDVKVDTGAATPSADSGMKRGESKQVSSSTSEGTASSSSSSIGAALASSSGGAMPPPTALEGLTAIWSMIDEVHAEKSEFSGDRMNSLEVYMKDLSRQLRQLSPTETASLAKALATVHYRNYQHISLLARRSGEVAPQLGHHDACQLYFNLSKLQSMDSMMPLVQRIIHFQEALTVKDVHLVAQALERQSNLSFAGGKLLGSVLSRAASVIKNAKNPGIHRSLLAMAARYNFSRHAALQPLLRDICRFSKDSFQMKDASVLLRSMTTLSVPASHPTYETLLSCVKEGVHTALDIRQLDGVMDVLSEVPVDSSAAMHEMMKRLERDAGKLAIPQLVNVLELLSSYPPARGHVCLVSLSFAAHMRAESIEATALESILESLSNAQHYTDDFFGLVKALFKKGGFRSFTALQCVLSNCPPAVLRSADGEELARNGILQLAPVLNDQELQQCRKLLMDKGINDRALHQRILSRAKQIQRGAGGGTASLGGGRRRLHDPMDDLIQ